MNRTERLCTLGCTSISLCITRKTLKDRRLIGPQDLIWAIFIIIKCVAAKQIIVLHRLSLREEMGRNAVILYSREEGARTGMFRWFGGTQTLGRNQQK